MKIKLRPRLHVGLISMHIGGLRKNGGVGFSVSGPCGILEMEKSPRFDFEDLRDNPLVTEEVSKFSMLIDSVVELHGLDSNIHVKLSGDISSHVGMGAGTGIRLAMLEGLFRLNTFDVTRKNLVKLSKRGGTSGVGINTYFTGGLVLDLGIRDDGMGFAPSSKATSRSKPITLPSLPMPDWPLCMCVPKFICPKTQKEEVEFFTRMTQITSHESYEVAYQSLFGIYASVIDRDFKTFCEAVDGIQQHGWKKEEWRNYGTSLYALESQLRNLGATGVGMSSFGPMLYCFADHASLDTIVSLQDSMNCMVTKVMPCNKGREFLESEKFGEIHRATG